MGKKIRKICLVLAVFGLAIIYFNSYENEKGIRIEEWNNLYEDDSLNISYEKLRNKVKINEKLSKLDETYKINEICGGEKDEIAKILKTVEILKTIVEVDDIKETKFLNGYDILKNKKEDSKKLSDKDVAIIERDLILTLGFESRIGILRKEDSQFKKDAEYYVIEYWSPKYNKWVMIDYKMKGYLAYEEEPIGALEAIEEDITKFHFYGNVKSKDYRKKINQYRASYTMPIDNTVNGVYSNSFITYVKNKKNIDLLAEREYLPPTIFTTNKTIYEKSPWMGKSKEDKKSYIILMKKTLDEEDKNLKGEELEKEENKFILGSFKNANMVKEYFYKVNDGEFIKVEDRYVEIYLEKGKNTIQISEDGKNMTSSIKIIREK